MSCIKFPSSKSDLSAVSKSSNKEADFAAITNSLIAKANQLFGEGNWSHAITSQTLDFIDYVNGKYQAGCASVVRVQLKDGTFHEDLGYNSSEGSSKGSAIQRVRLGSYNCALKKALIYFGSGISNRETKSLSRSTSPVPVESTPKQCLPVEASTVTLSKQCLLVEVSTIPSSDSNKTDSDQFEDIPMSQTDALMRTVDLDHLIFAKDQNSNTLMNATKTELSKPNIPTENDLPTYNGHGSKKDINIPKQPTTTASSSVFTAPYKKETKVDVPKVAVSASASKTEASKPVVYTAMTEEEMRLERKRKQREMQEEFKRKEEIKRKHVDNGSKATPNPRY